VSLKQRLKRFEATASHCCHRRWLNEFVEIWPVLRQWAMVALQADPGNG